MINYLDSICPISAHGVKLENHLESNLSVVKETFISFVISSYKKNSFNFKLYNRYPNIINPELPRYYTDYSTYDCAMVDDYCITHYRHMKNTYDDKRSYLVFDIDDIDDNKINRLFWNDYFKPNFYIYDYSVTKKRFTLQVFILVEEFNPKSNRVKKKYLELCEIFGADTKYQLATGIHKNPDYKYLKHINVEGLYDCYRNMPHTGIINIPKRENMDLNNKYPSINEIYDHVVNTAWMYSDEPLEKPKKTKPIKHIEPDNQQEKLIIEVESVNVDNLSKQSKRLSVSSRLIKIINELPNKKIGERNISLFDASRLVAYSSNIKRYEDVYTIVSSNNEKLKNPLCEKEITNISNSIYRFVDKKLTKKDTKYQIYTDAQRQLSAITRQGIALEKINEAIEKLVDENKKVTKNAIRSITGQNFATLKKYDADIIEYTDEYKKFKQQKLAQAIATETQLEYTFINQNENEWIDGCKDGFAIKRKVAKTESLYKHEVAKLHGKVFNYTDSKNNIKRLIVKHPLIIELLDGLQDFTTLKIGKYTKILKSNLDYRDSVDRVINYYNEIVIDKINANNDNLFLAEFFVLLNNNKEMLVDKHNYLTKKYRCFATSMEELSLKHGSYNFDLVDNSFVNASPYKKLQIPRFDMTGKPSTFLEVDNIISSLLFKRVEIANKRIEERDEKNKNKQLRWQYIQEKYKLDSKKPMSKYKFKKLTQAEQNEIIVSIQKRISDELERQNKVNLNPFRTRVHSEHGKYLINSFIPPKKYRDEWSNIRDEFRENTVHLVINLDKLYKKIKRENSEL